jgi:hypothetical protein
LMMMMMMIVWCLYNQLHLLPVLYHECLQMIWQLRVDFLLCPLKYASLCLVWFYLCDRYRSLPTTKSNFMDMMSKDCQVHLILFVIIWLQQPNPYLFENV